MVRARESENRCSAADRGHLGAARGPGRGPAAAQRKLSRHRRPLPPRRAAAWRIYRGREASGRPQVGRVHGLARAGAMRIRLGTRGSLLALAQSDWVAGRLRSAGHDVEVVRIVTEGDLRPVDTVPGEGIFVAAIANALKSGEIDVAVHSAKDVPLEDESDLVIAAYPERADPRDALVTKSKAQSLANLPANATVGTDSPRRAGFVRAARGDLRIVPLHGNVDTRLRRLDAGEVDALVIAAAGLDRPGLGARIDARIDPKLVTPAPAQGALAIQARREDAARLEVLASFDRTDIRLAAESERRVLSATGGTCRAPVGALATLDGDDFEMVVGGVNSDGSDLRVDTIGGRRSEAIALAEATGYRLAREVALR